MTRGLRRVLTGLVVITVSLTAGGFGASASSPAPAPAAKPGMISVAASQSSTGTYGAPLIDGCAWAAWVSRCQNLTVYGNGSSFDDAGCGAPNGCTFGPEFQCTELAQRYAYYAWGEPAVWDGYGGANGSAAQMWQAGPALPVPLQQFTQGGGIPPQRGDLLIFGPGWLGSYYDANGHVAVVTSVGSTSLIIVQENGTASGTDTFGLNGTTVTANGYTPVIGWLHNPVMSGGVSSKLSASSSGPQQNLFWKGTDNHLREAWAVGTTWYGPTDLTATWNGAAPLTSSPSAVFASDGKQAVYWRGAGGHLWQSVYSNGWSTPADLSTGWTGAQLLQSAPSAAIAPGGEQMVFWQGAGGTLMEAWFAAGTWYGPAAISAGWGGAGPLTSAPSVAIGDSGLQFVYWQSTNGHLWEAWYDKGWNGPSDLSKGWGGQGPLGSAPSVVIAANGDRSVFWKGSDNQVWEAWYNGTWNGPADWDSLGRIATPPTATVTSGGDLVVYWQNMAGDLASSTWNGRWNGPADLSAMWGNTGLLGSAPAATLTPDGSTQLTFWRGSNGHLLEAWYTGRWNGPIDLSSRWPPSAALASAPSVAVTPDGSTQLVFWQDGAGHLKEAWYAGSWNGPSDWSTAWKGGALLGSSPSVVVTPTGNQLIFWQGTNGHLWETWWAGARSAPIDWAAASNVSAQLGSAPRAVLAGGEQLVFWRSPNGHLTESWWGGAWSTPTDISGIGALS